MSRFNDTLNSGDYLQQANEAILTIVQIETREALEQVDAIAAVEGIDVLFVGPLDLGNNIDRPIIDGNMHVDLHAAIAKVLDATLAAGKKAGIFCTSGVERSQRFEFDPQAEWTIWEVAGGDFEENHSC